MLYSNNENSHPQQIIYDELLKKQLKNPSYSLRAFARLLDLSPTLLSQIFSNSRNVTYKTAQKVSDKLCLDLAVREQLLASVRAGKNKSPKHKKNRKILTLEVDTFRLISEPYHYGILGLAQLEENRAEVNWIAKRLRISKKEAQSGFKRLLRLGFIKVQNNSFIQAVPSLDTTKDIPSAAIRKFHKLNLYKAEQSLDHDPVEKRYFGSLTLAIDPDELPKIKDKLRKFKQSMRDFLAEGQRKKRVYHLAIQLFPVDCE